MNKLKSKLYKVISPSLANMNQNYFTIYYFEIEFHSFGDFVLKCIIIIIKNVLHTNV